MKRVATLILFLFTLMSCEKETLLSVDRTSMMIPDIGGSEYFLLTTNKPWTASSNQPWCKVSPTSSDEASGKIKLSCDPNTTFETRSCTITITCAEKTQTVTVSQESNFGLSMIPTEYSISKDAQQVEIKVQANVQFNVEVEDDCSDWVKLVSTKALKESTIVLEVSRNDSYEQRSGHITVRQTDGSLWNGAIIIQAPTSYLKAEKDSYTLSYVEQEIQIPVISNTDFSIEIENDISWITVLETKALKEKTISLRIEGNPGEKRIGRVLLKGKDIVAEVQIIQDDDYYIIFQDHDVEDCCLKYDTDEDGKLSYAEASAIKHIDGLFGDNKQFKTFDEFRYFTGVTQIPTSMFENWGNLTSITFPDNVIEIGAYAFNRCSSMKTIRLSQNLKRIGTYAFSNTGFRQIHLSAGIEEISEYAFYNSKLDSITIPGTVATISKGAFQDNSQLKSVNMEEGVQTIMSEAFKECHALDTISFANSIKSIGYSAFDYCDNLHTLDFPEDLEYIGQWAFALCFKLTTVLFKEKLNSVGIQAFDACHLTSLSLPQSLKSIGGNAFPCESLKRIDVFWQNPPGIDTGGWDPFYGTKCPIYIPKGSIDTYRNNWSWSQYGDRFIEREE